MLGSGALEKRMAELGVQRYRNRVAKGKVGNMGSAQFLLQESTACVAKALEEWMKEVGKKNVGLQAAIHPYLNKFPPKLAAFIALRALLDSCATASQQHGTTYSRVAHQIGNRIADEAMLRKFGKEGRAHLRKVLIRFGPRGHDVVMRESRQTMAVLGFNWEPWPKDIRVKVGSRLIELILAHTGIVALDWKKNRRGHRVNILTPTMQFLDWLREAHNRNEVLSPWHMPIPVPPAPWQGPYGGGYHTDCLPNTPLVSMRRAGKKHIDLLSRTDMPDVYAAINTVQNTAWEMNEDIYFMLKHTWEAGIEIGGLPSRFEDPLPEHGGWEKGSEEHKAWCLKAKKVHEKRRKDRGLRLYVAKTIFMAKEIEGQPFFFPHHFDFRGRMYPLAYFLQPQGPSFAKALLRFANGKPVTEPDAIQWFKIHGANCYGKDKISFVDRLAWVEENTPLIRQIAKDPLDTQDWVDADKPWEYLAWCLEYDAWLEDPKEFKSKIPVAMDGTTNGLQIFSLLLRDPIGAHATNCTPTDAPQDIYRKVAERVIELLKEKKEPYAGQWLRWLGPEGLPREAVKRQVMTVPYGSTKHACLDYLIDWYMEVVKEKPAPQWPADFFMPCHWLSDVIWDAIGDIVAGARSAMTWLQAVAAECIEQKRAPVWTAPSGMPVLQDYREYKTRRISTTLGDRVRDVSSRETTKELCIYKARNGISPNFVHSLDASALVSTVLKSSLRGVRNFAMIHDSFGTLAADAPIMAEALREAYADIFSGNLLENFRTEILAQLEHGTELPPVPEQGELDPTSVIRAPYFFA